MQHELAIIDLKRQAARVRRETRKGTLLVEDPTEYESQDNGLAEGAVGEIKGVGRTLKSAARSIRSFLGLGSRCWTNHPKLDLTDEHHTTPTTEAKSIQKDALCVWRACAVLSHW